MMTTSDARKRLAEVRTLGKHQGTYDRGYDAFGAFVEVTWYTPRHRADA